MAEKNGKNVRCYNCKKIFYAAYGKSECPFCGAIGFMRKPEESATRKSADPKTCR